MAIEAFLIRFGLPALFLGAGIEGETVVLLGGILVHRGLIGYGSAAVAAALGSFVADQLLFLAGRKLRDRAWVERATRTAAFARASAIFHRHPTLFVFGFRFVYGIRTASPLAIGVAGFPPRRFLLLNALAAAVWGPLFVTLGYAFGRGIEAAFGRAQSVLVPVLGAIVAAVAIAAALHWWLSRRAARRRDI